MSILSSPSGLPLPGFWHAAARLCGQVDLSPLLDAGLEPGRWPAMPAEALCAAGLPLDHSIALARGAPPVDAGSFLTMEDPAYPGALRPLSHAPPVLFHRGQLALLRRPMVAIVGARRCTGDGQRMARSLARAVSEAGGVVVSGLAYGIDAAAHGAVPDATIAVVGQGLGQPFSSTQQRLLDEILGSGGLVLSELLPGFPASRFTFPQRNRVIAGLAAATVVVEAKERSGALITARFAGLWGREVLAVPGHPLTESARGCLRLLKEGAGLVVDPADLIAAVPALQAPAARPEPAMDLDPILQVLSDGEASFDALLIATDLDPVALNRALAGHELSGRVLRLPGERYALRRPR